MIANVARWGNSLALRIPASFAKELSVAEGARVELSVHGSSLVITPVVEKLEYDLAELVSTITDDNRHDEIGTAAAVGHEFG